MSLMIHFPSAIAIHLFDKLQYYRLRRSSCFCHVKILGFFYICVLPQIHLKIKFVVMTILIDLTEKIH